MSDKSKIKQLVQLRKKNQGLEDHLKNLRAECFRMTVLCNRRQNQLNNIHAVAQSAPEKLIGITNNLSKILEATGQSKGPELENVQPPVTEHPEATLQSSTSTSSGKNKAHVVKPHMVNGHILYIPTINLTRVNADSPGDSGNIQPMQTEALNNRNESGLGVINEESEISEPSTSTGKRSGHSTLLSGTFQEVKIYLNSPNPRASRNVEESQSQSRKRSSATTSGGITTRKRRNVNSK